MRVGWKLYESFIHDYVCVSLMVGSRIDKSWIYEQDRCGTKYNHNIREFMRHLATNWADSRGMIRCPCRKCKNVNIQKIGEIEDHLYINAFYQSYNN